MPPTTNLAHHHHHHEHIAVDENREMTQEEGDKVMKEAFKKTYDLGQKRKNKHDQEAIMAKNEVNTNNKLTDEIDGQQLSQEQVEQSEKA